jgi:hypothetical protein
MIQSKREQRSCEHGPENISQICHSIAHARATLPPRNAHADFVASCSGDTTSTQLPRINNATFMLYLFPPVLEVAGSNPSGHIVLNSLDDTILVSPPTVGRAAELTFKGIFLSPRLLEAAMAQMASLAFPRARFHPATPDRLVTYRCTLLYDPRRPLTVNCRASRALLNSPRKGGRRSISAARPIRERHAHPGLQFKDSLGRSTRGSRERGRSCDQAARQIVVGARRRCRVGIGAHCKRCGRAATCSWTGSTATRPVGEPTGVATLEAVGIVAAGSVVVRTTASLSRSSTF